MKQFKFIINGNSYEVEVGDIDKNIAKVEVNGTKYKVELEQDIKKPSKTPTLVRKPIETKKEIEKKSVVLGSTIVSPLPGLIIEIKVKQGDEVKKGQTLLIMEAMKMENNILAEKDGTVKDIKVSTGTTVLQGEPLIELA